MDPYENLANGIIELEAKDYRRALKYIKKHPKGPKIHENERTIRDCERFFCGHWITELSGVDGKMIMNRIKSEIFND
ncbi:MAG TPA: hypothetical protein DCX82_01795 [Lachnospiraceae bacterium]|jgi:hypothetical protein|nr:hypothetical protein [Lachnospiraceae bacterium]